MLLLLNYPALYAPCRFASDIRNIFLTRVRLIWPNLLKYLTERFPRIVRTISAKRKNQEKKKEKQYYPDGTVMFLKTFLFDFPIGLLRAHLYPECSSVHAANSNNNKLQGSALTALLLLLLRLLLLLVFSFCFYFAFRYETFYTRANVVIIVVVVCVCSVCFATLPLHLTHTQSPPPQAAVKRCKITTAKQAEAAAAAQVKLARGALRSAAAAAVVKFPFHTHTCTCTDTHAHTLSLSHTLTGSQTLSARLAQTHTNYNCLLFFCLARTLVIGFQKGAEEEAAAAATEKILKYYCILRQQQQQCQSSAATTTSNNTVELSSVRSLWQSLSLTRRESDRPQPFHSYMGQRVVERDSRPATHTAKQRRRRRKTKLFTIYFDPQPFDAGGFLCQRQVEAARQFSM